MVMRFLRGGGEDRLQHIPNRLLEMLGDDRHSFDVATTALLFGGDLEAIGRDLRATDRRVNEAERVVRRDLVLHASVHGTADISVLLVYMSIVKDIERIGDYAKNIFDVAAEAGSLADAPDREAIIAYRDRISPMISQAGRIFADEDVDAAHQFLATGDRMLDEFDALVVELMHSDLTAAAAVSRALTYRYFKRIVAHLMNVLSAVVMPLDKLDYFDEEKRGRAHLSARASPLVRWRPRHHHHSLFGYCSREVMASPARRDRACDGWGSGLFLDDPAHAVRVVGDDPGDAALDDAMYLLLVVDRPRVGTQSTQPRAVGQLGGEQGVVKRAGLCAAPERFLEELLDVRPLLAAGEQRRGDRGLILAELRDHVRVGRPHHHVAQGAVLPDHLQHRAFDVDLLDLDHQQDMPVGLADHLLQRGDVLAVGPFRSVGGGVQRL